MKWFIAVTTVLLILSCQKEYNLGEDYNKIVGTWKNFEGDLSVIYIFNANGKIERSSSFNRKNKIQITSAQLEEATVENRRKLLVRSKGKDSRQYSFTFNNTLDTLLSSFVMNIDDYYYNSTQSIKLIKTQ